MRDAPVNPTPLRDQTPSLAHRLASGLVKIGLALNHHDRKTAGSNGLGLTQTRILEFLRQCPKRSARLSGIAKGLSITPATACESVRTLTQKGLVRKVRSETDERVVIITLSAKGQRKADHAAGQEGFLLAAAESLTPAEQEALLKTLLKMMLVIQERRHAPASIVQRVNGGVGSRSPLPSETSSIVTSNEINRRIPLFSVHSEGQGKEKQIRKGEGHATEGSE